jgi:hypothetical protein
MLRQWFCSQLIDLRYDMSTGTRPIDIYDDCKGAMLVIVEVIPALHYYSRLHPRHATTSNFHVS